MLEKREKKREKKPNENIESIMSTKIFFLKSVHGVQLCWTTQGYKKLLNSTTVASINHGFKIKYIFHLPFFVQNVSIQPF